MKYIINQAWKWPHGLTFFLLAGKSIGNSKNVWLLRIKGNSKYLSLWDAEIPDGENVWLSPYEEADFVALLLELSGYYMEHFMEDGVGKNLFCIKTDERRFIEKVAEEDDVISQLILGDLYFNGMDIIQHFNGMNIPQYIPQNFAKAAEWYLKAAAQGNAQAQFNLGNMYKEGQGVPQNYAVAAEWLGKAAKQGHDEAIKIIDEVKACAVKEKIERFREAAEQGDADAQYNVGLAYKELQDYSSSVEWFFKAAKQGHEAAKYLYAKGSAELTRISKEHNRIDKQGNVEADGGGY